MDWQVWVILSWAAYLVVFTFYGRQADATRDRIESKLDELLERKDGKDG